MMGSNGISLADIAAVTRGNGDGLGGDNGGIWAIILIIALCGGFNNEGGGLLGGRGNSGGSTAAEVQRGFDNQGVTNKLNALENGLCSLGDDQLAQMNSVQSTITNSIQQVLVALMQQGFNISTQNQSCCCTIENLLQQANYNRQADTCSITNAINQAAQAIMANDNNNYRSLHDEQIQLQLQNKDDRIAELTARLNRCDSQAHNAQQTTDILNQVRQMIAIALNNNGCCGNNNFGCCTNFA